MQKILHKFVATLFCAFFFYNPAFITTPTSINATLGSTATFNCSATTGAVGWLVNGSLLTELNTPDITIRTIGRTFFLHVPAREEYNNTFVRCVVVIRGGNTLYSDPVTLKVQGMFRYQVFLGKKGSCVGSL